MISTTFGTYLTSMVAREGWKKKEGGWRGKGDLFRVYYKTGTSVLLIRAPVV